MQFLRILVPFIVTVCSLIYKLNWYYNYQYIMDYYYKELVCYYK